jgi:hypothetical protein
VFQNFALQRTRHGRVDVILLGQLRLSALIAGSIEKRALRRDCRAAMCNRDGNARCQAGHQNLFVEVQNFAGLLPDVVDRPTSAICLRRLRPHRRGSARFIGTTVRG